MPSRTPAVRLVRLHVTGRPLPDIEPPYDATPVTTHAGPPSRPAPQTDGSLALALPSWPVRRDEPVLPPLRLVSPQPGPAQVAGDPRAEPPSDADPPGTDEEFDTVRTARAALPAPGPRAAVLIRAVLETISGDRPPLQLMRWVTPAVFADIESAIYTGSARSWAASMRRLVVTEPADGVAEVAAVVQRGVRATALAMRLEGLDGRWVVTALQLG
jgi:hypothetical protein